jgi:hypothetical protein
MNIRLSPGSSSKIFHVALNGKDTNPGTQAEPFATLHHARDIVRTAGPGCVVIVHAGTYYFGSSGGTLTFTAADNGAAGQENVYMAAEGEKVTISGGIKVSGTWEASGGGIYKCSVPANVGGDELFINDKVQHAARFPNYVDEDRFKQEGKTGYRQGCSKNGNDISLTNLSSKSWNNAKLQSCGAYLDGFHDAYWGNLQYQIQSRSGNTVTVGRGGFHLTSPYQGTKSVGGPSQYFCANIFEELDAAGEWVLDKADNTLYCYPPSGVSLGTALVELSSLITAVEFKGTRAAPVHHITLQGFRISHTEATFLENYQSGGINMNYSCGDWTVWRGGAVFMEGAENITVSGCQFDAVGSNGVFINNYAKNITVRDNEFTEVGESGVCIVGKSHINMSQSASCWICGASQGWSWGTKSDDIPSNCVVHNNLIRDIGRHGKQPAGVYLALTKGNTISHNTIYNAPRAGICLNDGMWGGHTIEWNDVHDCVLETGDHGPFNAWGRDVWWCRNRKGGPNDDHVFSKHAFFNEVQTTMIRYNRFAAGRAPSGWGMDLDDASSRYTFFCNLGVNIGFKVREGAFNLCENNIFYKSENQINIHSPSPDNNLRIIKNIEVYDKDNHIVGTRFGNGWGSSPKRWLNECNNNTYWGGSAFKAQIHTGPSGGGSTNNYTLTQWRSLGFDQNSAFEDPKFKDPANGDFTVTNQAVLDRGFKNFPMNQFGRIK